MMEVVDRRWIWSPESEGACERVPLICVMVVWVVMCSKFEVWVWGLAAGWIRALGRRHDRACADTPP